MDLDGCFEKSWIPVDVTGLVSLQVEAAVVSAIVALDTVGIAGVHLKEETSIKQRIVNGDSPWASC